MTTTPTPPLALPALPKPYDTGPIPKFSADQMNAHATAAILSDRAGRGDAAGWVSVPREPTREMRLAGAFAPNHRTSEVVWRAMIAARPAAPTGETS